MYILKIKEFVPLATFIAAKMKHFVPLNVAKALNRAIGLRQKQSSNLQGTASNSSGGSRGDESHQYFLGILEQAQAAVKPRMAAQSLMDNTVREIRPKRKTISPTNLPSLRSKNLPRPSSMLQAMLDACKPTQQQPFGKQKLYGTRMSI